MPTVDQAIDELLSQSDFISIHVPLTEKTTQMFWSEAIKRMRQGHIELIPGFDGEFGKIKIFDHSEREYLSRQKSLFSIGVAKPLKIRKEKQGDRIKYITKIAGIDYLPVA